MWVLFNKTPPVEVRGHRIPRFSIMWAEPWPGDQGHKQYEKHSKLPPNASEEEKKDEWNRLAQLDCLFYDMSEFVPGVREPNWIGAMKVEFIGEHVRVFPNECHPVDYETMCTMCSQDMSRATHVFVPNNLSTERIDFLIKEGNMRQVYEQALVDGANLSQAISIAYGFKLSADELNQIAEFPPIGWYRPRVIAMDAYGFYDQKELDDLAELEKLGCL